VVVVAVVVGLKYLGSPNGKHERFCAKHSFCIFLGLLHNTRREVREQGKSDTVSTRALERGSTRSSSASEQARHSTAGPGPFIHSLIQLARRARVLKRIVSGASHSKRDQVLRVRRVDWTRRDRARWNVRRAGVRSSGEGRCVVL